MTTNKIIYWVSTILFSAGMLMSSFMYLSHNPELMKGFALLGYPVYFVNILGTAKLLGAITLLVPTFPKLKEWAYAGFTFCLIGAVWTHAATGTPFVMPLVFFCGVGDVLYDLPPAPPKEGRCCVDTRFLSKHLVRIMSGNLIEYSFQLCKRLCAYQAIAVFLNMRKPFEVIGIVAAHLENAQLIALPLYRAVQMFFASRNAFFNCRRG